MKKSYFYKYGFGTLLFLGMLMVNYILTNNINQKKILERITQISFNRMNSLLVTNNIIKRRIDNCSGIDIKSNERLENILESNKLFIIILNEPNCNKCQEKELLRLETIHKKQSFNVIGITIYSKKNLVLNQLDKLDITFPTYCISDSVYHNEFMLDKNFPQIIYVENKLILSAFVPIALDTEFSEIYFSYLFKSIIRKN